MIISHRILGWVEAVTVCDCCGKANLSGTFACETAEGDVLHYGSTCARRNTGIKNPTGAAAAYLREREAAAQAVARLTPEFRAMRARFAERERAGILPGKASRDFVAAECAAMDVVGAQIAATHRLPRLSWVGL